VELANNVAYRDTDHHVFLLLYNITLAFVQSYSKGRKNAFLYINIVSVLVNQMLA